jgi:16S rRNA (adenine1518-N6/adenine1519-N6)-dimethyltransferase
MDARFESAVFLIQLEVANRLMAKRMTRDFGYLTVMTQLVCTVELICKVEPKFFNPPPKVDSAAIRLVRRNDIPEDLADILLFASRCLRQKRKTIRNNLRAYYGAVVDRQPEGFMRAEQLGVAGLVEFYRRLSALVPGVL